VHYLNYNSIHRTVFQSLILTLTGKSNVLATTYFPAIDLSDDDYKLGLMNFETYNTISNVNASNNKFYFDENNVEITIPEGSYELQAINEFLKQFHGNIRSTRFMMIESVASSMM